MLILYVRMYFKRVFCKLALLCFFLVLNVDFGSGIFIKIILNEISISVDKDIEWFCISLLNFKKKNFFRFK